MLKAVICVRNFHKYVACLSKSMFRYSYKALVYIVHIRPKSHSNANLVKTRKVKVKLLMCFNWAPRHKNVVGEWRYSSRYS
jgi:hypothetical protein